MYSRDQMLWLLFISSHNFLWLLFKSGYHSREAFVEDRRKMKKSSNGGVAADARESRVATTWEQRVIEWIQYFVVVPSLGLPSPHCYWCCWFGPSWEESSEGVLDGGNWQPAAVDPSERSQPHPLHPLRAGRYHPGRENRNITLCRGRCDYHGEVWLLSYHDMLPP